MSGLTEHVMINKWDDDINEAIQHVGGDTTNSSGLPDYADIIRTQLVSNRIVGEGVYDNWLFGAENTNNIWEAPTVSTNAPQATVVANAIHDLYEIMANTERYQILLVDDFPNYEYNLSAIYLVKIKHHDGCECECCCCKDHHTYVGCYYIKEGKEIRRIDIPRFNINIDELFYVTREEYTEYTKGIESVLRKQFGRYLNDGEVSIADTMDALKEKCDTIDEKIKQINITLQNDYIQKVDLKEATQTESGLMSASDKVKLDNIGTMNDNDINILK